MQDDGCRDIDGQIERIRYYEEILSQAEQLLKDGMEPDEDFAGKLRELDEYYGSEEWRKDLASDEAGLLPETLKRGVLSEDGIYNVLEQFGGKTGAGSARGEDELSNKDENEEKAAATSIRDSIGYIMGLLLFIILIPFIMWKATGDFSFGSIHVIVLVIFGALGIALSIWSIVYMKIVGKGNPMDAFNHEIAPRTSELMTDGPYKLCRNPMLLGVFIYYTGFVIFLHSWQALVIFIAYIAIMMIQVSREEKRLEEDFGEAYIEYKNSTAKIIPHIW